MQAACLPTPPIRSGLSFRPGQRDRSPRSPDRAHASPHRRCRACCRRRRPSVELDGFRVVRDGLVEFALVAPDEAAVVIGKYVLRIEPDRLAEVGDGLVEFALVAPDEAAVVIGRYVLR